MPAKKYLIVAFFGLCFSLALAAGTTNTTTNTTSNATTNGQPAERYELCQSTEDVQALQQQYGLTLVSSVPTKAAFMPGWPTTVLGFILSTWTIFSAMAFGGKSDDDAPRKWYKVWISRCKVWIGRAAFVWTCISAISWTVAFVTIEVEKSTAGWLAALSGLSLLFSLVALMGSDTENWEGYLFYPLVFFMVLEVFGGWAVLIQRWSGKVGTIAYMVTDLNGCTPSNGIPYLQQGARSRAFRIIQTCEAASLDTVAGVLLFCGCMQAMHNLYHNPDGNVRGGLKFAWAISVLVAYLPEIIYESIIAAKGTPVVISGDCMLVELNPRWGFFDLKIANGWKAIEALTGL
jgi:hypothetical protein